MLKIQIFLLLLLGVILNTNAEKSKNKHQKDTIFNIKKGINISHWLSQTNKNNKERELFFNETDVKLISSLGYDHMRLPIDEKNMWTLEGEKKDLAFKSLHKIINLAKQNNLKVIVDLHIVRSHFFNDKHNPLWEEKKEQKKFIALWKQLSSELKKYSNTLVAYEILNEPVAEKHKSWNNLLNETLKVIRLNEPKRTVIIGSNKWQSVDTFKHLQIPSNDANIILSFHFYTPFIFTHYKAPWSKKINFYKGSIKYPGFPITKEDFKGYNEEQTKTLETENQNYSKEYFLTKIKGAIEVAEKYNLKLYCGEFGALPTTPLKNRMQWYKDIVDLFEENNIMWANWDYRGGFGIRDRSTGALNKELIEALSLSVPKQ